MNFDKDVAFPNKIRVIDLLNKIANGEEVPSKIKYDNIIFELNKIDMTYENSNSDLSEFMVFDYKSLNDEVEILEEEKKIPRKLGHLIGYDIQQFDDLKEYVEITTNDLFGKLNKVIDTLDYVIDYLKSKGDE